MATTEKLGLFLPVDPADIEVIHNPQMDIIDKSFSAEICTLAAPPLEVYPGKLAYFKDTQELRYWDSTLVRWVYISARRNGWGKKAYVTSNAKGPDVGRNQEKGPYMTATYTQTKDRIYKVFWNLQTDTANTADFGENKLNIRYRKGDSVSTVDALLYWMWLDQMHAGTTSSIEQNGFFNYTAEEDAQVSLGVFLARSNEDNSQLHFTEDQTNTLIVEDVGWNG